MQPCCVLEQDTFLPESTGELPRKRWLRPDMTEKLLTGTLSLNTNKQTKSMQNMSLPFLQLSLLKWSFKCHAQGKGAFGVSDINVFVIILT